MAYSFKYRINSAPVASQDGSGCIQHDIEAMVSNDGGLTFAPVPGRHKTICVPASQVAAVLAMPANPANAKVSAYKNMLAANLETQPVPIDGWSTGNLTDLVTANDAAATACIGIDAYIVGTLHQTYPILFAM